LCQGIKPTDIVLEPSAGCGELVQAALDAGAAHVYAVEYNPGLCEVLRTRFADEKRVSVHCEDVLSMAKLQGVTRIVMNPPFEKNQDVRHVRCMFDTYDVPIRAITSAHWTFADDKASMEMRLLFPGPYDIRENAFATAQRRTGVSVAVVHIDPEDL
jgi:predicted RNA methylase